MYFYYFSFSLPLFCSLFLSHPTHLLIMCNQLICFPSTHHLLTSKGLPIWIVVLLHQSHFWPEALGQFSISPSTTLQATCLTSLPSMYVCLLSTSDTPGQAPFHIFFPLLPKQDFSQSPSSFTQIL